MKATILIKGALIATAIGAFTLGHADAQQQVVVSSWGGSYQDAQREAVFKPFEKETGIKVVEATGPTFAKIRAMITSGNVDWDVGEMAPGDFTLAAREGMLEKIDYSKISASVLKDIDKRYQNDYGLAVLSYSKVLAYSTKAFTAENHPRNWADFWNLQKFPGPRVADAGDYVVPPIEYALLADGVPADKLYPLDLERAYKALDRIRPYVVKWATTAAMQPQAIVDGEAVMGAVTLGRVAQLKESGAPIDFVWDGGLILYDYWVIPKGAKNQENALKFIEFASRAEVQGALSKLQLLGPVNSRAFEYISADRAKLLPTYPDNLKKQIFLQPGWWAESDASGKSNLERNQQMWNRWILK